MNGEKTGSLLHFSRKDRVGALIILFTVSGALGLTYWGGNRQPLPVEEARLLSETATLPKNPAPFPENTPDQLQFEISVHNETELFAFDPNTASAADWQRLGLSRRTTQTILNYRSKGGKFYKPEDLQKIWGLDASFYNRVKDYIHIPAPPGNNQEFYSTYERKPKQIPVININEADSAEWTKLPGIGPVFSSRIVRFREKLGGFTAANQVKETYGLPDSTFEKLKPYLQVDKEAIQKININKATAEELKEHPYINWNLAKAITAYREQHGSYQSLADLKQLMLLDDTTYEKIRPYLTK